MTQSISISRIHYPIHSLGFGTRVGVWFQGCQIQCPGCVSRDTWAAGTDPISLDQLTQTLAPWTAQADGLTISGGEPFDQPDAVAALVDWWRTKNVGDVLLFSGYSAEVLWTRHSDIVSKLDVLISDPYDAKQPQTQPLRGSDNQRMNLLTPLAAERYASLDDSPALDLCFDDDTVWIAGIPKPNAMAEIRKRLAAMGFAAGTSDQLLDGVRG
ncbi:anaerobic ribonucleotide reductase-activating protein [Rosistilla carotiformis]|uniref:Anaerobic ribonucleotide reductase-activating protein n=1 Tax=Rosistilla carotiformis TaxID=2528017 RepID=A0A518JTW0_9BACT|nr:4Fe-4S single cluster domain-containing protein [Rosistilla carotiformis]QDV68991.1 anaerobic ribonucleotide reductase-activating protein [Rosistilla carotiformis]